MNPMQLPEIILHVWLFLRHTKSWRLVSRAWNEAFFLRQERPVRIHQLGAIEKWPRESRQIGLHKKALEQLIEESGSFWDWIVEFEHSITQVYLEPTIFLNQKRILERLTQVQAVHVEGNIDHHTEWLHEIELMDRRKKKFRNEASYWMELLEGWKHLQHIYFHHDHYLKDEILSKGKWRCGIKTLVTSTLRAQSFRHLQDFPNLQVLKIRHCNQNAAAEHQFPHHIHLPCLKSLTLWGNVISLLPSLKIPKLKRLSLVVDRTDNEEWHQIIQWIRDLHISLRELKLIGRLRLQRQTTLLLPNLFQGKYMVQELERLTVPPHVLLPSYLPKLKYLKISELAEISPRLHFEAPLLKHLVMEGYFPRPPEEIDELNKSPIARQLKFVEIKHRLRLNTEIWDNLRGLKLRNCQLITLADVSYRTLPTHQSCSTAKHHERVVFRNQHLPALRSIRGLPKYSECKPVQSNCCIM